MWPGFKSRRRCHNVSWVCSETFFCRYSAFPLSSKTNISKFQFQQESGRRRTTLWMCYLQIIIYLFYWSIYLFNISWPSSFIDFQFVMFFLVLRHSVVHSTIVLPPLVWRRPCREKFKNSSVFWVSMSEKRYLPTVLASNNFTIKYLCFSKAVLKKLNNIKICLYLKLKRLKRDRTLYKLRKKRIYNGWLR